MRGRRGEGKGGVRGRATNRPRRFAPALDRWLTAVREGTHPHDGDPFTSDHVKAAHLERVRINDAEDDGRTKYKMVKGDDRRLIDAAIADVLAYEAAMTMAAAPPPFRSNYETERLTFANR